MALRRIARQFGLERRSSTVGRLVCAVAVLAVGVASFVPAFIFWSTPSRTFSPRHLRAPFRESSTRGNGRRSVRLLAAKSAAVGGLDNGPSDVWTTVVEAYNPEGPHEFEEGPPPTGYRNITEALRPYHPNPEWMIFPAKGFARDQKICSLYTLATGLYQEINKALREDNEDSIRRHMSFIHELREVLRFEVPKICTREGRKCRPFIGNVSRGLTVPVEQAEAIANLYQVGTEFTWPGFTSTQLEEQGLWPFDGNVNFEIECNIDPKTMNADEVYAPVRISRFLQGSHEVLFPPQTKFRVVGDFEVQRVKENEETKDVYTKRLEVVELPTAKK